MAPDPVRVGIDMTIQPDAKTVRTYRSPPEGLVGFMRRQGRDLAKGGVSVLLRKVSTLLGPILAIPTIIIVRALRPVVLIRLGRLRCERLGHLAANTELYLCGRDVDTNGVRVVDLFAPTPQVCNRQLQKMWKRTLHVSPLVGPAYRLNRWFPGYTHHVVPMPTDRDTRGLFELTSPHLSFTSKEERQGQEALLQLGIAKGAPFVCVHSRDSAYMDSAIPDQDWDYHNFRDSNVQNFIAAAEELVRRGYFAVRTGAAVNEPLDIEKEGIIDYATYYRTEFLDMYLGANCRFYLGDSCGFHAVPMVFRRPLAIVNMLPIEYAPTWGSDCLFIPKKLWLHAERRFLTIPEIIESHIGRFLKGQEYEQLGIEPIENTSEEISALAVEMHDRLNGTWTTTDEDEELQRLFWSSFEANELNGEFRLRIGAEFLRQNRELLAQGTS